MEEVDKQLQQEINSIGDMAVQRLLRESQGNIYNLFHFPYGSLVTVDLRGEEIDGALLAPDQRIVGLLASSREAILDVTDATNRRDLIGWRIGLAMRVNIRTPAGILPAAELRSCFGPNAEAGYFLAPRRGRPTTQAQSPPEITYFGGRYKRIAANDTILFDTDW